MKNRIEISGFIGLDEDRNVIMVDDLDVYYGQPLAEIIFDKMYEYDGIDLSTMGEVDDEMGGLSYYIPNCNISFYISDNEISLNSVSERYTMQLLGGLDVFGENYGYSQWTILGLDLMKFTIGNHDLTEILTGYEGKYINFIMEY